MRNRFLSLLAAALLPALSAAADPAMPPGHEIAGHWLSVSYMKAIEKSRSPLQASRDGNLVALLIDAEQAGYALSVTSYHEGLNYGIRGLRIDGGKVSIEADSYDDGGEELQTLKLDLVEAPDGARLLLGTLWGEERVMYRKLPGTVAAYVSGLTVAGSYVDEKGLAWAFEKDGHGVWAGGKQMYEVTLDTFENDCDTLSHWNPDKPEEQTWTGFRWQDGKLALYEMVEGGETMFQCAAKPFAVLTKKN